MDVKSGAIGEPTIAPVTPAPKARTGDQLVWIDILRGLAAIGVVLHHVRVDLWVGWQAIRSNPAAYTEFDRAAAWLSAPLPFLGAGVMLFFLLSGFCIHYPYVDSKPEDFKTRVYAIRRFIRIYPPYLAALLLSLLVERVSMELMLGESTSLNAAIRSAFMLQNYGGPTVAVVGNPSLWSLPIEMEFYILYPFLLLLLPRFSLSTLLWGVGLVSVAGALLAKNHVQWFHYSFPRYWIIWCAGALLAEWQRHKVLPKWNWIFTALLPLCTAGGMATRMVHSWKWIEDYFWGAAFFLLILWGLNKSANLPRWKPPFTKAMIFLGTISYSLYLIHFPFFRFCGSLYYNQFKDKPHNLLFSLLFVLLAIPVAWLFYRFIEKPTHQLARRWAGK